MFAKLRDWWRGDDDAPVKGKPKPKPAPKKKQPSHILGIKSEYCGPGQGLTSDDIEIASKMYGYEPAAIKAVVHVEAAGTGFHASGAPKILYEPHIAYRRTSGAARDKLIARGLAYKSWGAKKYPRNTADRYKQLDAARAVVGDKAYEFISMGLPQMMGFNYKVCGYKSAAGMFKAFTESEGVQLMGMLSFIKKNKNAHAGMRAKDWKTFARAYNGPGYAKNRYDTKLASAYRYYKNGGKLPGQNSKVLDRGDRGPKVTNLQKQLNEFNDVSIDLDGVFGPATEQAVRTVQKQLGLKVDGIVDAKAQKAIDAELAKRK